MRHHAGCQVPPARNLDMFELAPGRPRRAAQVVDPITDGVVDSPCSSGALGTARAATIASVNPLSIATLIAIDNSREAFIGRWSPALPT